ncbi:hypothetical protein HLB44_30475 [Aquincola sp. S2]|uniref:Uncharacterized protein n=1 Tax=Pseudaquabacterium terrae TaxID=2732868 RepID=A0ABX2ERU4_9BURK|nr:hypothetical protein [Aquabacterium terrae]NRF71323.1 hypothetical protein [Aquabacterium terrae]
MAGALLSFLRGGRGTKKLKSPLKRIYRELDKLDVAGISDERLLRSAALLRELADALSTHIDVSTGLGSDKLHQLYPPIFAIGQRLRFQASQAAGTARDTTNQRSFQKILFNTMRLEMRIPNILDVD